MPIPKKLEEEFIPNIIAMLNASKDDFMLAIGILKDARETIPDLLNRSALMDVIRKKSRYHINKLSVWGEYSLINPDSIEDRKEEVKEIFRELGIMFKNHGADPYKYFSKYIGFHFHEGYTMGKVATDSTFITWDKK